MVTNGEVDSLSAQILRNRSAAEAAMLKDREAAKAEMLKDRDAAEVEMEKSRGNTKKLIEKLRMETQAAISEMRQQADARLQRLEDGATVGETKLQELSNKLASVPNEDVVTEWARSATATHLRDPTVMGIITTACDTANSSITASVEKGSADICITIKNEKARLMRDLLRERRRP